MTKKRTKMFLVAFVACAALTVPIGRLVLWKLRGSFVADYKHRLKLCRVAVGEDITAAIEERAGNWAQELPGAATSAACRELEQDLAAYRDTALVRAMGFAVVLLFGALLTLYLIRSGSRSEDGWMDPHDL